MAVSQISRIETEIAALRSDVVALRTAIETLRITVENSFALVIANEDIIEQQVNAPSPGQ